MLNREFMLSCFLALLVALRAAFWIRTDAALEVLALRQQVAVLKRKRPRPLLNAGDRLSRNLVSLIYAVFGITS